MAKLTPKQKLFVQEYLVDLNATAAAARAKYSDPNIGRQLITKHNVIAAIAEAQQARSHRTEITADMVLQRWWELANADVNELVEYRRDNCRHCWGAGHQYQWTEPEFEQAKREATEKGDSQPDAAGGFGFVATREPNAECPECQGEGKGKIHVHDTRRLRGAARRLYAGVHQGKDGLKVLLADRDKALENVARHLGMFNDKLAITGKDGGPIQQQTQHSASPELLAALKNIIDEV